MTIILLSLGAFISFGISLDFIDVSNNILFNWLSMVDFNIKFGVEWVPISSYISSLVYIVFILVVSYSLNDFKVKKEFNRIIGLLCLLLFFVQILLASSYIGQIIFSWLGIIFSLLVLSGLDCNNNKELKNNSLVFFTLNFSSVILFIASIELGNILSSIGLEQNSILLGLGSNDIMIYFFIISLFCSFSIMPFNFWIDGISKNVSCVNALLFGVLLITTSYILFHIMAIIDISQQGRLMIALISIISAIFSSLVAMNKKNIFNSLGYIYSTISSFVLFGFAISAVEYALLFSIVQFIAVVALFLIAGSVSYSLSSERDMTKMGGLAKSIPEVFFMFLITILAILCIPPFSGFFARAWLFSNVLIENKELLWWLIVFSLVAKFTLAMVFGRIWGLVFYGDEHEDELVKAHMNSTSRYALFSLIFFSIMLVSSGWIAQKIFFNINIQDNDPDSFIRFELFFSILINILGLLLGFANTTKKQKYLSLVTDNTLMNNNFYIFDSVYILFASPFVRISNFLKLYEKPELSLFIKNICLKIANYITICLNFVFSLNIILSVTVSFFIFAIIIMLLSIGIN
ncbi:MAG: proton-conducting transporter membrane subunit [Alphaproteobacteria bacterium]|nr:proton-conducting transporter membrane subunit [Alphaproteobacteria bacterium]